MSLSFRRCLAVLLMPLAGCGSTGSTPSVPSNVRPGSDAAALVAAVDAWHAQRLASLQRPHGWLSLVGLHWIEPGRHRLGRAPDTDIVLAVGPARLGTVTLDDARFVFEPAAGSDAPAVDVPLSEAESVQVDFADGRGRFVLIRRGGRLALRVSDTQAPALLGFRGVERYPVDPGWRIEARFEPHPPGTTLPIANVIGQLDDTPNPGAVVFERDGRSHRLEALDGGDGALFLILADRTNRSGTYGAGRFLYTDPPLDGRVVLDFNRAYNPPCAFNDYSTCPLPPPENRLDLAVTAGERRYVAH